MTNKHHRKNISTTSLCPPDKIQTQKVLRHKLCRVLLLLQRFSKVIGSYFCFFCWNPLGPPKIKKRSKNGPDAHLRNIQQIQEYCDKVKSDMTRPRNRSFAFLKRTHYV